jgi:general secretion pathway protein D
MVRESVLTDENTRPIFTGTSQAVELIRRDPSEVLAAEAAAQHAAVERADAAQSQTTSANAASAMLTQLAAQAHPLKPGSVPTSQAAASATAMMATPAGTNAPIALSVVPQNSTQAVGSTFQVAIMAANAHDLYSVPMQVQFNPKVLALVNVDSGDLLGRDGQAVALVHRDEGNGAVTISASRPPNVRGVDGQGPVCTLTFKAVAAGDSALSLVRVGAKDSHGAALPAVSAQGMVRVK